MRSIKIGRNEISKGNLNIPYMIAEAGVNHEGDIDRAKQMIKDVSETGCNAIKFQAYKANTIASKDSLPYWDTTKEPTQSQYELFKKYDKFWKEDFEELAKYAGKNNLDMLVTPFDIESVDFLEQLVPAYKIASADINNKPFLEYIARKDKPILLSTGASNISEIWNAIEWIKKQGNDNIGLLHCVLNYPTDYSDANLGMIFGLSRVFPDNVIGYSDHTSPEYVNDVLITAWLLGAQIIEKHYTWNKLLKGNDHYHSIDTRDLKNLMYKFKFIRNVIGDLEKHYLTSEIISRKFARRSLVAKRLIRKDETIEEKDLTWKRPGEGIPPGMIEWVIGATAAKDIEVDKVIFFDDIKISSKMIGNAH